MVLRLFGRLFLGSVLLSVGRLRVELGGNSYLLFLSFGNFICFVDCFRFCLLFYSFFLYGLVWVYRSFFYYWGLV